MAVAIGAFGSHALKGSLDVKQAGWYDTAVFYQFVHGIAILICAQWPLRIGRAASIAGWTLVLGVLLFCGSLYTMALGGPRWLGAVTPVGGCAFILGWIVLCVAVARSD